MYTPKEKQIYSYPPAQVSADPLEVRRKLVIHSGNKFPEWVNQFNDGESELAKATAEDALVGLCRTAFGLQPIGKGGVCDAVVLELLAHYLEWLSTPSAQPINPYLISQPCTDCPPPH